MSVISRDDTATVNTHTTPPTEEEEANAEFEEVLEETLDSSKATPAADEAADEKKEKLHEGPNGGIDMDEFNEFMNEEERQEHIRKMKQKAVTTKMIKFVKRQLAAFSKNFVDYGPPYDEKNVEGSLNLIATCSQLPLKLYDIHTYLNERVNPNVRDNEDLHFTAMHWSCRNCSLLAIKMLRRAKADVNITNELNQTPLIMAIITKQRDRRSTQLKIVKYLLEEGADINIRDKAGYGPVDYAAMNNDFEILTMLCDAGAIIIRNNKRFHGPRKDALALVTDPDCYRVLYLKIQEEQAVIDAHEEILAEERKEQEEIKRVRKLHASLAKRRETRIATQTQTAAETRAASLRSQRAAKFAEEEETASKLIAEQRKKFGEWKRDNVGHWEWECKASTQRKGFEDLFPQAKQRMHAMRESNSFEVFNTRWKRHTGKSLEVDWSKSDQYKACGGYESEEDIDRKRSLSRQSAKSGVGGLEDEDKCDALAYRDENDEELQGEDFDNVMDAIRDM